uniref:Lipoprotein n=1 Tax=Caenorhabditis tropicalis TaxID=1561998 RepID=A0A1I7UVB5_9PELO
MLFTILLITGLISALAVGCAKKKPKKKGEKLRSPTQDGVTSPKTQTSQISKLTLVKSKQRPIADLSDEISRSNPKTPKSKSVEEISARIHRANRSNSSKFDSSASINEEKDPEPKAPTPAKKDESVDEVENSVDSDDKN